MIDPQLLDLYTDSLITSQSHTTATGLAKILEQKYSHDQVTRFLSKERYHQKTSWRCIKSTLRHIEQDDGVMIVDDTIEEKPYTDENAIVCWHDDHTTNHLVKGINLVNVVYHREYDDGTDFSLPAAFEVISKTLSYVDSKTGKHKRKSPVTKNALVRGRLKILAQVNQVRFRDVLWDSWYSSADNLKFVKLTLGKDVIGALTSNRTVALSSEDKQTGTYVTVSELDLKPGVIRLGYLKGVSFPVLLAKQLFTNKDGSSGVLYLVSTDTDLSYADITTLYKRRWKVETFHKSLKQNAALAKSPTKVERTQRNHIFAAMLAFLKLEKLKLSTTMNHFALKRRLYITAMTQSFAHLQEIKTQYSGTLAFDFA